jgi:hypothetical protein
MGISEAWYLHMFRLQYGVYQRLFITITSRLCSDQSETSVVVNVPTLRQYWVIFCKLLILRNSACESLLHWLYQLPSFVSQYLGTFATNAVENALLDDP